MITLFACLVGFIVFILYLRGETEEETGEVVALPILKARFPPLLTAAEIISAVQPMMTGTPGHFYFVDEAGEPIGDRDSPKSVEELELEYLQKSADRERHSHWAYCVSCDWNDEGYQALTDDGEYACPLCGSNIT